MSGRTLLNGEPVPEDNSHTAIDPATGMQKDYVVLSEAERAKGFVKPVRQSYVHNTCHGVTEMGIELSQTYARDPSFYSGTYCVKCKSHFPLAEFDWMMDGEPMDPKLQPAWAADREAAREKARQRRIQELLVELEKLSPRPTQYPPVPALPTPDCGEGFSRQAVSTLVMRTAGLFMKAGDIRIRELEAELTKLRPQGGDHAPDRERGIYHKFDVTRTDGTSEPGKKHDGCFYFVLDLDHDPHAKAALQAYAHSCRAEYPKLADDLNALLIDRPFGAKA